MKLTLGPLSFGQQDEDRSDPGTATASSAGSDRSIVPDGRQLVESRLVTKLISAVFIGCLVAGPLALALGGASLLSSSSAAPPPAAIGTDRSVERVQAGEFATRVVIAWLSSSQDDAEQLTALVPSSSTVSPGDMPFGTSEVEVASIAPVDDAWSVTVAATVTDETKTSSRRFFQIPVSVAAGSVSALALPTPVSGPAVDQSTRLDYGQPVDSQGPLQSAVGQFLDAYLAGVGDVSRYVSPGTEIRAISPAPFASVEISSLSAADSAVDTSATPAEGTTVRVLATAEAAVSKTQTLTVNYALTMKARAGRWEVAAIDQAPVQNPQKPSSSSASADPPSATTPTPEEE